MGLIDMHYILIITANIQNIIQLMYANHRGLRVLSI